MRHWIRREDRRVFAAGVVLDLLGQWTVVKTWGSLDSDRGGMMVICCADEADANNLLDSISKRRAARGYEMATKDDIA